MCKKCVKDNCKCTKFAEECTDCLTDKYYFDGSYCTMCDEESDKGVEGITNCDTCSYDLTSKKLTCKTCKNDGNGNVNVVV